jgi:hypothetical protein
MYNTRILAGPVLTSLLEPRLEALQGYTVLPLTYVFELLLRLEAHFPRGRDTPVQEDPTLQGQAVLAVRNVSAGIPPSSTLLPDSRRTVL